MLLIGKGKSKLTRQQSLAARPEHRVDATIEPADDGGARLIVKLRGGGGGAGAGGGWRRWLLRLPEGARKTFELDALGLLVWNLCDGKHNVQQIIRRLAKQHQLNLRQAEVATLAFLATLTRKGLIGMPIAKKK